MYKNIFSSVPKSNEVLKRIDMLNIFEYFLNGFNFNLFGKMYTVRKASRTDDMLMKEIIEYFSSSTYNEEFKTMLNSDSQKFRFFLMHRCLLNSIIQKSYFNFNLNMNNEQIGYYINKEYNLSNSEPAKIIIYYEIRDALLAEQIEFKKIKKNFLLGIQKGNNKEIYKKYLFSNNEVKTDLYEKKLNMYFSAHSNYLRSLNIEEIKKNKIFWGLNEISMIN